MAKRPSADRSKVIVSALMIGYCPGRKALASNPSTICRSYGTGGAPIAGSSATITADKSKGG